MSDKIFVKGMYFEKPSESAPDWIVGKLSIKRSDFAQFVKSLEDSTWINIDIKEAKSGKCYCELSTWKPTTQGNTDAGTTAKGEDDLPF